MDNSSNTEKNLVLVAIVDDHVYTATFISTELENKGYKTLQAYNAPEAIKKCKSEHPNIIILDLNLPGLGGFDVANNFPNTKIIFMTADDDFIARARNTRGCVGVIKKPIDINQLNTLLDSVLKRKK